MRLQCSSGAEADAVAFAVAVCGRSAEEHHDSTRERPEGSERADESPEGGEDGF